MAKRRAASKRQRKKPPDMLGIGALAEAFGVSVGAVRKWRAQGLPVAQTAARGKLLFDSQGVEKWLHSKGIQPGAIGREGGVKRQQIARARKPKPPAKQRRARAGSATAPPGVQGAGRTETDEGDGATTTSTVADRSPDPVMDALAETLDAVQHKERQLRTALDKQFDKQMAEDDGVLAVSGMLQDWTKAVESCRKLANDVFALQVKRHEFVSRLDFVDTMRDLAAFLRARVERFADEVTPQMVMALGESALTISDMALFQRVLHATALARADAWLAELSREVVQKGESSEE